MHNRSRRVMAWLGTLALAAQGLAAEGDDAKALAEEILRSAGVAGGLCVHLGCGDGALTAELAATGKFLVHAIDPDAGAVQKTQALLHARGLYGLAWAEERPLSPLPYTENLVNLIVMDAMPEGEGPPLKEILRVLRPNGVAYVGQSDRAARHGVRVPKDAFRRLLTASGIEGVEVIERQGVWARIQKPWPDEMDEWPLPRHGPDGNAASRDALVGPPRRIRWVTGPWHEASNMATAGGRLYHGGLIVRDAFNSLRLWSQPLHPAPLRFGFPSSGPTGSVVPVVAHDRIFAFTDKQVVALDPASGTTLRAYPEAGMPAEILHDRGVLYAIAKTSLRALDATDGKLLWTATGKEIGGLVTGDGGVFLLEGDVKAGEKRSLVCLDRGTGRDRWRKDDYPWLPRARRLSHGNDVLVCEVSTFKDDKPGNSIHVLSARDGGLLWERIYEPGMSHYTQARAIQTAGLVWVLLKNRWEGLSPKDGSVARTATATGGHCFPPVGTPRFLISGEMSFADVATGKLVANRITKGNCSREAGFMPANGLLYVSPKHCACWPMLRGYAALAPAGGSAEATTGEPAAPLLEKGPAYSEIANRKSQIGDASEWPCYRADCWRSGSTPSAVPPELEVLWTAKIGGWPQGLLAQDWHDNLTSRGPLTQPVAAGGLVVVARPDTHRVLALDAQTGERRWDFTANGRVDTAPTLFNGLCLFGTRSGWVYCLRAADGQLVWRLRAAPHEERIVAFGQLESPWPVPGSVLVANGVAYFAAGRHPLADGGILVFAVEPLTGAVLWVKRLNTLPMTGFYNGLGLEFDPIDLLVAEAERPTPAQAGGAPPAGAAFVTLSRWRFAPRTGEMTVVPKSGFACARAGGGGVMVPRGVWSYGPRMDYGWRPDVVHAAPRPLAVFRDGVLVGSSEDLRQLFRRDFSPETLDEFNDLWYSHGQVARRKEDKGDHNRNERLARGARWTADAFPTPPGAQGIAAMALAGDAVFVAGKAGRLFAYAVADGTKLAERDLPAPVWDGLAAAYGKLFLSTQQGELLCLGKK
ncbi:MAG TPA: PQQ-binding-like beta-propeller repeat protein [Planctomycetota bacterium]|nr:PQQ-binding-like beta-propeller repeat protein [Planctomycetota bacterium]